MPEALAADVNAIKIGHAGKLEMIYFIYGKPKPASTVPGKKATEPIPLSAAPPITPRTFDAVFGKPRRGRR